MITLVASTLIFASVVTVQEQGNLPRGTVQTRDGVETVAVCDTGERITIQVSETAVQLPGQIHITTYWLPQIRIGH